MSEFRTTFVPCRDCGDLVEIAQVSCGDCSPPIPDVREQEHVRVMEVPELRALIDEWRENGQKLRESGKGFEESAAGTTYQILADELEGLIDE